MTKYNFKYHTVISSSIEKIAYDYDNLILKIVFNGGAIYNYNYVPVELYEDFKRAESAGKFFYKEVRGQYECYQLINKKWAEKQNLENL